MIYCYTNLINNKKYIGQTNNLKRRIKQHLQDSLHNYSEARYNQLIHQAIRKYGIDNFKIEVLEEEISDDDIDEREQYYIKYYNTISPNGYNLTEGGLANKTAPVQSRISDIQYKEIINDLKSDKTLHEIADKHNISYSYLSGINNGSRLFHSEYEYPIRKSQNNYGSEYYQKIIDELKNTTLSQAEIAKKLNISKVTVQKTNTGNIKLLKKLFPNTTFPIRKK